MRYADQPSSRAEVTIAASAEVVWALITDVSVPARFSREFQGGEWLDAGPALGARFLGHNFHEARGGWDTVSTVDVFDPERAYGWTVGPLDDPAARWRFAVDVADQGVRLVFEATMGPGPSGIREVIEEMPDKEERIVARRLADWQANMEATVEGIKGLAETGR